jgi:hypothetical protein
MYLLLSPVVLLVVLGFKKVVFEYEDPTVRYAEGKIAQCTKKDLRRGVFHIKLELQDGAVFGFTEPQDFVGAVEASCRRQGRARIGYTTNKRRNSKTPNHWMVSLFDVGRGATVLTEADSAAWHQRNNGYGKMLLVFGIALFAGSAFVVGRARRKPPG